MCSVHYWCLYNQIRFVEYTYFYSAFVSFSPNRMPMNSPDAFAYISQIFRHQILPLIGSAYNTPSCSPGSLLTRFCSQLSKSLAASFCRKDRISNPHMYPNQTRPLLLKKAKTHVVLLLHIDPAPVLADPQFLILGHRLHFTVVTLVA